MKAVLKLFNLVYIVLAAIACVALFTKPIVSINGSVNLGKDDVTNLIYPSFEGQGLSKEEVGAAVEKSLDPETQKFTIRLMLEVPPTSLLTKDAKQITTDLTSQASVMVDDIVNGLEPTIKELAKTVAKKAGREAIKDSVAAQINITNPGQGDEIIESVGLNEDIDNLSEEVFELLLGDEPVGTVSELMDNIQDNVYDICGKLANAGVEGYPTDPEELAAKVDSMNENIESELKKALMDANLCEEDGTLKDMDAAIDDFLISFLDQLLGEGDSTPAEETPAQVEEGKEEEKEVEKRVLAVRAEGSEEEEESKLKQKIREVLNKKIEDLHIDQIVDQYWFVPLIFTIVLILPWLIFIIITVIRTLRKSKCWTKAWIIFAFAVVQVLLGIALYLISAKFIVQILDLPFIPDNPAVDIVKNSTLIVQTSSFIPSILYLAMIPLTIAYMIIAHKIKKNYKEEKIAKKLAKKSA